VGTERFFAAGFFAGFTSLVALTGEAAAIFFLVVIDFAVVVAFFLAVFGLLAGFAFLAAVLEDAFFFTAFLVVAVFFAAPSASLLLGLRAAFFRAML